MASGLVMLSVRRGYGRGFPKISSLGSTRSRRVYGGAEFWLAIKVVIVVFVLSGVFMIAGVMGDNSACRIGRSGTRPSTTVSWASSRSL